MKPLAKAELALISTKCPIILDVGANVGMSSQRYLALFPRATIHAFEPFPSSFEQLEAGARRFPNLSVHAAALGDAPGTRKFYVNEDFDATNSLLPRPSEGRRYYPPDAQLQPLLEVPVWTLDGFCKEHGVPRIDLLKLDVQGAELLVLEGATRLLASQAIDVVFTEAMFIAHYEGGVLYHELASFICSFGYSLFSIYDLTYAGDGQVCQCNALFVSPQVRESVLDRPSSADGTLI